MCIKRTRTEKEAKNKNKGDIDYYEIRYRGPSERRKKSTLFNSLTKAGAESANYPFCTIDPNVGIVPVPDKRLQQLGDFYQSKKVTPAVIEFVDIAGLVKGASKVRVLETSSSRISVRWMPSFTLSDASRTQTLST